MGYDYRPDAMHKPTGKTNRFGQALFTVKCPKCGREWNSVNPTYYTCGNRGGKQGCGYQWKRS